LNHLVSISVKSHAKLPIFALLNHCDFVSLFYFLD
jgi:hypothetical protein